jgi:predicted ABC-type ATPase
MLAEAKNLGYHTRLFYVGTDDLSINISRIKARVLDGGHDVPIEDQIRRYARSFENLPRALERSWALGGCGEASGAGNSTA